MTSHQSARAVALVTEGHALLRTGRTHDAERAYREALTLDPGQPEALAFLGMMAGQAGQLRDAIEFFERALKRAPRNADIHHNLGETWRHLGDNVKALACFERAARINPDHLEAYRSGADTALAEAARRQAAGQRSGAAALKRTAVELLIHAGRLLRLSGNLTAAADILRRATEIDSSSAPAWAWYGGTLAKSYPSRAVAALRRSIELDPKVAWVHGLYGTTATCEALWMGVPVITLIDDRHSARVGLDLLTRVGLSRFAAPDIESYVQTAAALAADRDVLAALRAELRERVAQSPLCDAVRFTRAFETALRAAWRQWCTV